MVHDVFEDVEIDVPEMSSLMLRACSERTVSIAKTLTNPHKSGDHERDSEEKSRHYRMLAKDVPASIVKTADRIFNLRTLEIRTLEASGVTEKHVSKAKEQLAETVSLIVPIAESAGLRKELDAEIAKLSESLRTFLK